MPIKPYWARIERYHLPTIEEALLGFFKTKVVHNDVVECIFQKEWTETAKKLSRLLPRTTESMIQAIAWLRMSVMPEDPVKANEELWTIEAKEQALNMPLLVTWARVNMPGRLQLVLNSGPLRNRFIQPKIDRFVNGHLDICRMWDSGKSVSLSQAQKLYDHRAIGKSTYADDEVTQTSTPRKTRVSNPAYDKWLKAGDKGVGEPPSYLLQDTTYIPGRLDAYSLPMHERPSHYRWRDISNLGPETEEQVTLEMLAAEVRRCPGQAMKALLAVAYYPVVISSANGHSLYAAALLLIDVARKGESYLDHYYMAAFVDLFHHCLGVGEITDEYLCSQGKKNMISPIETYYPWPGRAFHGGDLPSLLNAMNFVYFYGEKTLPTNVPLMKLMVKCLPFCCAMRGLAETVSAACMEDVALWKVVSRILWCCLAGMYPDVSVRPSFRMLLRINYLCRNRSVMCDTLTLERLIDAGHVNVDEKHPNGRVVVAAFREYFIHMCKDNESLLYSLGQRIKWDEFVKDTKENAECIRGSNMLPIDAFRVARVKLHELGKDETDAESNNNIYRFRKNGFARTMDGKCNKLLDTTFMMGRIAERRGDTKLAALADYKISAKVKSNILTYVQKASTEERYCFDVLRDKRLGGVSELTTHILYQLHECYMATSASKKLRAILHSIELKDFQVVSWYFNVLCRYQRIHLAPIHPRLQREIEFTMRYRRYILLDRETIPEQVYNVIVTACCERVATLCGQGTHGADLVYYDLESKQLVCAKTKATTTSRVDPPTSAMSKEKRALTANRKERTSMICDKQPVLQISLKGRQLIWGNVRSNMKRYMYCPHCGSLHRIVNRNWIGTNYMCRQCWSKTHRLTEEWKCAYGCTYKHRSREFKRLLVYAVDGDPCLNGYSHNNFSREPGNCIQWLSFCDVHYRQAYKYRWAMEKNMVWQRMKKLQAKKAQKVLAKYNA